MFLFANADTNEKAALTDLINPTTSTLANSSGLTLGAGGYQGTAASTTKWVDTKFKPSTNGGSLWTTTTSSFGVYDRTSNSSADAGNIPIGAYDGTNFDQVLALYIGSSPTANRPQMSTNAGAAEFNTTTNSQGFHICTQEDNTHLRYAI